MSPSTTWRIIYDSPADGSWNMAVDEAILESCLNHSSFPTLRLYAWQPACLSLGYSQPFSDVDLASIHHNGWQLVRRPTGGRAILHVDELTYSITGLLTEPALSGSLLDSYAHISKALQLALEMLGVQTLADEKYSLPDGSHPKGAVCFEVPSNYEITANGRKLIGSAQARRKNGLLQHGTLPLQGDLTRITRALTYQDEASRQLAAERVLQRATTLELLTGRVAYWSEAAAAFEQAFSSVFEVSFTHQGLTNQEFETALALQRSKYNHPDWTERL